MPFGDVIVGVDGGDGGRDAIALARLLVARDGRLALAHVRVGRAPRSESQQLLTAEREHASVDADLISASARSVAEGLHELVSARGADLLVIGSCLRGAVGRVLAGDDTRAVLHGAPSPVAVAPRGYAADLSSITRVGVGYNESEESRAALELARGLAAERAAQVRVLQVVNLPGWAYAAPATAAYADALNDLVADAQDRIDALDGEVEGRATSGIAGEQLARFADQVDLLVVGSRGYGPVRRVLLGSTSEYLARHAACPLLVLPRVTRAAPVSSRS